MLSVAVTIRDVSLRISKDVSINIHEGKTVADLIRILVAELGWPEKAIDGQRVPYALMVDKAAMCGPLTGFEVIGTVGILNSAVITIGPILNSAPIPAPIPEPAPPPSTPNHPDYHMVPLRRP